MLQKGEPMNDLISRQAAIDATWFEPSYTDPLNVLTEVRDRLKALPSAQPEHRWIPCSERLPEVRQWVLCQCRAGIMDVLRLTVDGSWNKDYPNAEYMGGFVIAWMPLPEPYEGGNDV